MSFVSSVSSASLFASSVPPTNASSLRPFANLNLSEDQRTQLRSIFQNAKAQGLSQSQVQQQINAILTPAQQQQLQSDIQQAQTSPQGSAPNPFSDPNGPFANLDLSSSQQRQIQQLLQAAKAQGLTPTQVNAQISALLTPAQQSAFTSDLQNLPQQPGTGTQSGGDPVANLDLTDAQKSQIDTILQQIQAGTITQEQGLSQIKNVLTPAQQTALQQDEQTAQTTATGHHHHHHGDGGATASASSSTSSSSPTLPNGVSETDIQNQVAAATSLILNQLQSEVAATASA